MRLRRPRIAPLADAELSAEQRELLAPESRRGPALNVFRTLVRDPELYRAFMGWGRYVLRRGAGLGARERELVVLRIGFLCRSGYEWAQHVSLGTRCGLSAEEIARIKAGSGADGWDARDRALLRAAEELHTGQFVTDATWAALGEHYDARACMDVVFAAAQYTQVSMILNSFGTPLDAGQTLDPDLDAR